MTSHMFQKFETHFVDKYVNVNVNEPTDKYRMCTFIIHVYIISLLVQAGEYGNIYVF